jgi:AraC-like DNA-binding protein
VQLVKADVEFGLDSSAPRSDRAASAAQGRSLAVVRLDTRAMPARHRLQFVGDVLGRQFCNGDASADPEGPFRCRWTLAGLAPGVVVGDLEQSGLRAGRAGARLHDGDADVTLFLGRCGIGRIEQGDRRVAFGPGEAGILHHGRALDSMWDDCAVRIVRLPRAALPAARIDAAGGARLGRSSPALALLNAYVDAVMPLALGGGVPALAVRHLTELGAMAISEAAGIDVGRTRGGPAVAAARLAAMREVIGLRFAEPMLAMADVARAVGLSERAGYLVFEAGAAVFSETLVGVRLDRARALLHADHQARIVEIAYAVGFSDLSHFNRRFRARFGMTPSEARHTGGAASR